MTIHVEIEAVLHFKACKTEKSWQQASEARQRRITSKGEWDFSMDGVGTDMMDALLSTRADCRLLIDHTYMCHYKLPRLLASYITQSH